MCKVWVELCPESCYQPYYRTFCFHICVNSEWNCVLNPVISLTVEHVLLFCSGLVNIYVGVAFCCSDIEDVVEMQRHIFGLHLLTEEHWQINRRIPCRI